MNLLLDENLSPRLLQRLATLYPAMTHVRDIGLKQASDGAIWQSAREKGYTIVTTDSDFVTFSQNRGWPPRVIHLAECDFPLRIIEELLRKNAARISDFDQDPRNGLLVLRFDK